jgi:hypothetical protein
MQELEEVEKFTMFAGRALTNEGNKKQDEKEKEKPGDDKKKKNKKKR